MGSDDLFNRRSQERKSRESKEKQTRNETWLFVCEGEETEPNYFRSLIEYANSKSANKKIKYKIEGTGRNTESLVASIEKSADRFPMLYSDDNLRNAVRNAKKLYCEYEDKKSFSDKAPCTTVFRLIEEMEIYFGIPIA